jgi:AcrR family transcriptional regulator
MAEAAVKENRKEVIFDAALKCFNKNGYYKTSMDLIAESSGMTKRGLYYHFKSKDELFINLFNYMNNRFYEQIPLDAAHIQDPEERLMMFVKIARTVLSEHADFLKFSQEFMAIGVRKPKIRKVMTAYYREQVEKVSRTIEQAVTMGKFIHVDPLKMARAIVLMTMGAFNVYFCLDADFDLADQHSFDIEQIIRCLKNSKNAS